MEILYLCNSDAYHVDIIEVMKKRGHELRKVNIPDNKKLLSEEIANNKENEIIKILEEKNTEVVFSLDYYPCISMICGYYQILYVSWIIHPAYSSLFSSTIINKNNLVFATDKQLVGELQNEGIENIFYLPQGVNIGQCEKIISDSQCEKDCWNGSFVGCIKDKKWKEFFQTEELNNETLGYLDGILASQSLVYGMDFWSKPLPLYVEEDLKRKSPIYPDVDSVESVSHYYREQCFYPKTAITDSLMAVGALAKLEDVYLFSDDLDYTSEGIINKGAIIYKNIPEIIKKSMINVRVAPRGLRDGLYGPSLQVMGMGGFLITDYRPELEREFIPGEDLIIYEDILDMSSKAVYFKNHQEEREKIARKAQEKIREKHTLDQRIETIERYIEQKLC